jgi:hypothetical protein
MVGVVVVVGKSPLQKLRPLTLALTPFKTPPVNAPIPVSLQSFLDNLCE